MKLSCKESARLLSERLDTPLDFRTRVALTVHLAICRGCRAMSRRLDFLRRAMRSAATRDDSASRGRL